MLLSLVALGCDRSPFGYTPIADIIHAPGQYEGKAVKVRGEVTDAVKLPVAEVQYYVLKDGDGELVVFPSAGLPATGSQVSVIGTVNTPAIIGGAAIGLHLVEQRRW
jgi:hypothetical protein